MRINNNLMAMNTHRQLGINSDAGAKSIEKLSSGQRINRAGDDAAGLAISEKMRAQIRGLGQASRNAQDSISLVQTAEGALNETQAILQRMRELAVQSSNDTNVNSDRSAIQNEVDQLATEITRISNNTEFNERKLLDGGLSSDTGKLGELTFHIGANTQQNMQLSIGAMDAKSLGISRDQVASASGTASTGTTNIASSTFTGPFGAGIVDGATLSLNYTAAVVAVSPVAAGWDTGAVTALGDAESGTFTFNGVTITVNGGGAAAATVTGANAVSIGIAAGATANTTAAGIIAAANAFKAEGAPASSALDNFTFGGDGATGITVTGLTADGNANNGLAITLGGDLAIAGTLTNTTPGVTAVAAKSANVVITSSAGHTQTVNVTAGDTSLAVTTGNFKGMTLNFATNVQTDADGAATVLLGAISNVSTEAQFSGGALVGEAVTYAGVDISTQANADAAITTLNTAITTVSTERAKLGAVQNRLEHTIKNLDTSAENLQASESRIRDVDMAKEMMNFTKNNILQQAAQAMLAQANQAPQGVLQLLR